MESKINTESISSGTNMKDGQDAWTVPAALDGEPSRSDAPIRWNCHRKSLRHAGVSHLTSRIGMVRSSIMADSTISRSPRNIHWISKLQRQDRLGPHVGIYLRLVTGGVTADGSKCGIHHSSKAPQRRQVETLLYSG
jgi:hypothetical protein